jgi:phosphate transport system substrate-binding protein
MKLHLALVSAFVVGAAACFARTKPEGVAFELSVSAPAAVSAVLPAATVQGVTLDQRLPEYRAPAGVSGRVKSMGSDTMNNLMTLWLEGFKKFHSDVRFEVEGKGSSTAPTALIEGTADFGPMSRPMKQKEIDDFEKKFGYKPTLLRTGIDMLAVYVHKDNPIQGLTLEQVDAIVSKTRRGGAMKDIATWGDLGLTGEWANKPISLYGRNSASGTYGFFKDVALFGGDYKDTVKEQAGSSSVVQGIASDRYAIGYSGIGYRTADVRAVPLAQEEDEFVPAEAEHAYDGAYPLSRYLYVYLNHKPGSEIDPLRREFVRYVFSKQGQQDVIKDGYFPVTALMAAEELRQLGISVPAD